MEEEKIMMKMNNKKTQTLLARIVVGLLVLAMVGTMLTGLISALG